LRHHLYRGRKKEAAHTHVPLLTRHKFHYPSPEA